MYERHYGDPDEADGCPVGTEVWKNTSNSTWETWAFDPSVSGQHRALKSGKRKFAVAATKEAARELADVAAGLAIDLLNDTRATGAAKLADFDRVALANGVGIRITMVREAQRANCLAQLSDTPRADAPEAGPEARIRALIAELNALTETLPDVRFGVCRDGRAISAARLL